MREKRYADSLRHPSLSLEIPTIPWSNYYNKQSIDVIKGIVEVFSIVNPKLLLIVSAWAEALGNRPNSGTETPLGTINPGVSPLLPKIHLIEMTTAPPTTKNLLLDIAKKHQALDVASDFRALDFFPQFLSLSWSHLRPYVGSSDYVQLQSQLKTRAIDLKRLLL